MATPVTCLQIFIPHWSHEIISNLRLVSHFQTLMYLYPYKNPLSKILTPWKWKIPNPRILMKENVSRMFSQHTCLGLELSGWTAYPYGHRSLDLRTAEPFGMAFTWSNSKGFFRSGMALKSFTRTELQDGKSVRNVSNPNRRKWNLMVKVSHFSNGTTWDEWERSKK